MPRDESKLEQLCMCSVPPKKVINSMTLETPCGKQYRFDGFAYCTVDEYWTCKYRAEYEPFRTSKVE